MAVPAEGTRWCYKCKQDRPVEEFPPGKTKCRSCINQYQRERYEKQVRESEGREVRDYHDRR